MVGLYGDALVKGEIAGAVGASTKHKGVACAYTAEASFFRPAAVAVDYRGAVYVADAGNHVIRIVEGLGEAGLLAGEPGASGMINGLGNGARFNNPADLVYSDLFENGGVIFVADRDNNQVRKVSMDGRVESYPDIDGSPFFFNSPEGLAIDDQGNLYVACAGNNKLFLVQPNGVVSEVAFGPQMAFTHLTDVALNSRGELFVADKDNHEIFRRDTEGNWSLFASGAHGVNGPVALGADNANSLYVTNESQHNVICLDYSTGAVVSKVISGSQSGSGGDADGMNGSARLNAPAGLFVRGDGDIYLADAGNHKIKKLSRTWCDDTDPCETTDCGSIKWHLDQITVTNRGGQYQLTDLDGYFENGRSTTREQYTVSGISVGSTAGATLFNNFLEAYNRNFMVELPAGSVDLYLCAVQPLTGSPFTSTQMPLLRDNAPINISELDEYYLVKAVIRSDCNMSCEVEVDLEGVDCYKTCEENKQEIKRQMYEVYNEMKSARYSFRIGFFSLPFYRLVDHFYPFSDEVLNYLPDDKAQELYLQYASLKEFYAQFDMDMCVEGCQTGLVDAPPCTSCNSVFIDCAYEKADALLAGVEHMLNKWAESEVA